VDDLAAALDTLSRSSADAAALARRNDELTRDVDFRKRVIQIMDQALEVSRALSTDAEAASRSLSVPCT
jgi:hypothetical protein